MNKLPITRELDSEIKIKYFFISLLILSFNFVYNKIFAGVSCNSDSCITELTFFVLKFQFSVINFLGLGTLYPFFLSFLTNLLNLFFIFSFIYFLNKFYNEIKIEEETTPSAFYSLKFWMIVVIMVTICGIIIEVIYQLVNIDLNYSFPGNSVFIDYNVRILIVIYGVFVLTYLSLIILVFKNNKMIKNKSKQIIDFYENKNFLYYFIVFFSLILFMKIIFDIIFIRQGIIIFQNISGTEASMKITEITDYLNLIFDFLVFFFSILIIGILIYKRRCSYPLNKISDKNLKKIVIISYLCLITAFFLGSEIAIFLQPSQYFLSNITIFFGGHFDIFVNVLNYYLIVVSFRMIPYYLTIIFIFFTIKNKY